MNGRRLDADDGPLGAPVATAAKPVGKALAKVMKAKPPKPPKPPKHPGPPKAKPAKFKPAKVKGPKVHPLSAPGFCQNHCGSAVANGQCHDHCSGSADTNCHDHCYGSGDTYCHDHCYGRGDIYCHSQCYGAQDTFCHNSCFGSFALSCVADCHVAAPTPRPTPTPSPPPPTSTPTPTPTPTPAPNPQARGQQVVGIGIPSDANVGSPNLGAATPGAAGLGLGGRANALAGGRGSGGGRGTSATHGRVTQPLARGTAGIGRSGTRGRASSSGRGRGTGVRVHPPSGGLNAIPGAGLGAFAPEIAHFIQVIPWWVWLILGLTFAAATAAGVAAWRWNRAARAQAGEVALVKADAMTDPLTGILNRRGFAAAAQRELERAQRYGHPLALAFVDVRGLKSVNDTRGHQAGDQLLKQVANLLTESSRSHDLVGRIGGDELAVMLTEQGAEGMTAVLRRVRSAIPATRTSLGFDHDWDLTIGMAVFPRDGHSLEALLAAADRRLYMQRGITLR